MEGFYLIRFQGVQGFGSGVLTLAGGKAFGGDGDYLWLGTFTETGDTFNARVHISEHTPGLTNVMGQTEFNLELTGTRQGAFTITCAGECPASVTTYSIPSPTIT